MDGPGSPEGRSGPVVASGAARAQTARSARAEPGAQLIGGAAGSAVAGFLIDGVGVQGAFIAAAAFAAAGTIVSALCVRWFPDLRYRDASPLPDTAPIRTVMG